MPSLTKEKLDAAIQGGATYQEIAEEAAKKRPEIRKMLDSGKNAYDAIHEFYGLSTGIEEKQRAMSAAGNKVGREGMLEYKIESPEDSLTDQQKIEREYLSKKKKESVYLGDEGRAIPYGQYMGMVLTGKRDPMEDNVMGQLDKDDVQRVRDMWAEDFRAVKENYQKLGDGGGPSIGRTLAVMPAQIAMEEAGRIASARTATKVKNPVGKVLTYVAGSVASGAGASIAAQKMEGREDISEGRVLADAMLNVLPTIRATKGPKLLRKLSEKAVENRVATSAIMGATFSPAAAAVERYIETGELPSSGELAFSAGAGALFGGGLGYAGVKGEKLFARIMRKNPDDLQRLINKGEPSVVSYFNAATEGVDPKYFVDAEDATKYLNKIVDVAKERPNIKVKRQVLSSLAPSFVTGEKARNQMISAQNVAAAGVDRAGQLGTRIQHRINKSPDPLAAGQAANEYLAGKIKELPPELKDLGEELSVAREEIRGLQQKLLDNHNDGTRLLPEPLKVAIEQSMNDGDYVSRSYRAFSDKEWKPDDKLTKNLLGYLTTDGGMSRKQAEEYVAELNSKMASGFEDTFRFMGSGSGSILKKKKDVPGPIRAYLGEYIDAASRVSETYSKLSRAVAYDTGDRLTAQALIDSGVARLSGQGDLVQQSPMLPTNDVAPAGWVEINLRRGKMQIGDQTLLGPPELQRAINSVYGMDIDGQVQGTWTKIWEGGVSAGKAVKVPYNPISYAPNVWGNMVTLTQMGMNPTRGAYRGLWAALSQFDAIAKRAPRGVMKMVDEYKKLGVLPQSMLFEDIQAGLKRGPWRRAISKYFGLDFLGKLYSSADMMLRIVAFENYANLYRKASGSTVLDSPEVTKKINEIAARHTNMTYQNYDMLNKNLRMLSRKGLMPQFVSFTLENIRNQVNQLRLGYKMASGKLADEIAEETGLEINKSVLRREGIKRMVAMTSVYAAAEGGRNWYNRQSMDEEQETAMRRTVLPGYDAANPTAINVDYNTGKYTYSNFSYLFPPTMISGPMMDAIKADDVGQAMRVGVDYVKNSFVGEGSFLFRSLGEAVGNVDYETARRISDETDSILSAKDRGEYFVKELLTPGFWNEYKRNQEKGNKQTMLRLAGVRLYDGEILNGASFKFSEIKNSMNSTMGKIAGLNYRLSSGKLDQDAFNAEYENLNATYQRNQERLSMHIKDLKTLKRSDEEIFRTLRESGIGAKMALYAYDGKVLPAPSSKEPSVEQKYEMAMSENNGDFRAALKQYADGASPFDIKRFTEHHQAQLKYKALNIKTKDDMIKALDVANGDRARYIFETMKASESPGSVFSAFMAKGLVPDEVVLQIQQLKQAAK